MLTGVFLGLIDGAQTAIELNLSIGPDGVQVSAANLTPAGEPAVLSSTDPTVIAFATDMLAMLERTRAATAQRKETTHV